MTTSRITRSSTYLKPESPQETDSDDSAFVLITKSKKSIIESSSDFIKSSSEEEEEEEVIELKSLPIVNPDDSDSDFESKATQNRSIKRVSVAPKSDSSDLSEVLSEVSDSAVAPKRKRQPKKPKKVKYDWMESHPLLKTIWNDISETKPVTDIMVDQPALVVVKLLPFQLQGLSWLQRQELTRFNGGILADGTFT